MVTKTKTVKNFSNNQNSLETRIDSLEKHCRKYKEESERKIFTLESRVNSLENIIKNHEKGIKRDNEEENIGTTECNLCDYKFKKGMELKKHIATVHVKNFECRYCNEQFDMKWKLEIHMQTHENVEKFKCSDCEKTFLLKWRLRKHKALHGNSEIKCCHYFNNKKPCPYDVIGCKFRHVEAARCTFQEKCIRKLCPYKHDNTDALNKDTKEHLENIQTLDMDDPCEQILSAAEESNEEEELLSDSFIDKIMASRENKEEGSEEDNDDILDTSAPIKYYPNCKKYSKNVDDCVECIIKNIQENEGGY